MKKRREERINEDEKGESEKYINPYLRCRKLVDPCRDRVVSPESLSSESSVERVKENTVFRF